ncbi:hypothetical protein PVAG01_07050 [Phlyctema vagabunda]|uniref:NmrA-like domain-containing protein n=1 Tax=Phlyctema vagabunda TaxID=108571 RepID=A0ABR4PBE7_9HELO
MSEIKTVAIAGAGGNVGVYAFKALFDAGFKITVLTRAKGSTTYDASVKVIEVDYSSIDSLTAALQGQDAVVSTVAATAIESQTVLINAAIAAGVKRLIPSDYGSNSTCAKIQDWPIYSTTAKIQKYLIGKSKTTDLTYSFLASGTPLDLIFSPIGLVDFQNHKVELYDGGDNRISASTFPSVGKAISEILKYPAETKNRLLRISQTILQQNKLLAVAKELRPDISWEITEASTDDQLKEAFAALNGGYYSQPTIVKYIKAIIFSGDRYESVYDVTDNELLGIESVTDEQLKELLINALG